MTFIKSLRDAIEALERIRDEHSRINTDEIWACGWCGSNVPIDSQADIQHSDDCPVRISILALANLRASESLAESDIAVDAMAVKIKGADPSCALTDGDAETLAFLGLRELDTLIGKAVGR